jgi:diguanylate cyclase (GGDEF)-like protein
LWFFRCSVRGYGEIKGAKQSSRSCRSSQLAKHLVTGYSGDTPYEAVEAASASAWARMGQALPDARQLHRALATSEQQLKATRRQLEELRRRDSLLKKQVALLEREVIKARRFTHHDELTGLPTRRLLLDRFVQAVARTERQHKQLVLLFLDVDGFKRINDVHGHPAGDNLLLQIAARLTNCIRASDTACRFGGDEFVVLLTDLESHECAVAAAEKIRAKLAKPYVVGHTEIEITTSIGMAVYPVDGKEFDDLIQASDLEMYRSKKARDRSGRVCLIANRANGA